MSSNPRLATCRRIALLAGCCAALASHAARAGEIAAARETLARKYAAQFDELAGWCDEHQLPAGANQTRHWQIPRDPLLVYAFELATTFSAPADASGDRAAWWDRFASIRRAKADELFALARQAIAAHEPRAAHELLIETLRENPDHEQARTILSYQQVGGQWQTPFDVARAKAGQVWSDRFGWLPAAHVTRYAEGSRYYNGRWVGLDEDTRLHRDIQNGWRIETEHYAITTNVNLEEGVALSRRLERLYAIWQQVFPMYALTQAELESRFKNPKTPQKSRKQHNVVYFRSRDQYNRWFVDEPQIAMTLGIYRFDKKAAFFFAGEGSESNVIEHEATHQLFWETRPVAPDVGAKNNFWAIEAAAVFMESLEARDDYYTLGGPGAGRVPAARQRLLKDDFYVPLAEMVALGMKDLQRDPRLSKLYSQSAGLAWYFMVGDGGDYRDIFTSYLQAIYSGRADEKTLARLTGRSYQDLDAAYQEFIKQTAAK
jgi:hypothetical protein